MKEKWKGSSWKCKCNEIGINVKWESLTFFRWADGGGPRCCLERDQTNYCCETCHRWWCCFLQSAHTHTHRTERERDTHSGRDKQRDRERNGERGLFFFFCKQDFAPSLGNGLAMEPHWLTNAWNFELPAQYHNTCARALGHVSTWEYTGLKWAVPFLFFFLFCCPKHNTQLPSACRLFCERHYPRSERSKQANINMGLLAWEITSKVKEFHVGHVHEHCGSEHSRKGEHVNKIECFLYVTYMRVLSGKSLNQTFSIIGNTIKTCCFQLFKSQQQNTSSWIQL